MNKTGTSSTLEAFTLLLSRFDSDSERAGKKYEPICLQLAQFFEYRDCSSSCELTYETLNRVARKIVESEEVNADARSSYCYGVARNVYREYVRSHEHKLSSFDVMITDNHPIVHPMGLAEHSQDSPTQPSKPTGSAIVFFLRQVIRRSKQMSQPVRLLWLTLMLIALICVFEVKLTNAQSGATSASISGIIKDEQGRVIGGSVITAKNVNTNLSRQVVSAESGSFVIIQLPPGLYELSVAAEGLKTHTLRIELGLGTIALVNVTLQIGNIENVIEITEAATTDFSTTESSTNLDRVRIDNLPINRRNFLDFTLTSPRAALGREPSQGVVTTSNITFNGQSARVNNVTVDGLDNNNVTNGSVRTTFSQDAVQEFQIVSDSYSAEFGRATGGVVNIVTKGGTNDFHGRAFFIYRGEELGARNAMAAFKAPFERDQFGATLSGPFKRDKVFFFTSFERFTQKQNAVVTISDATVASARRQGFIFRNGPIPTSESETSFLVRTDALLSPKDQLFIRYNYGGRNKSDFEPFGGLVAETSATAEIVDDNTIALTNIFTSDGSLINETRFLYLRRNFKTRENDPGPNVQLLAPEGQVFFGRNQSGTPMMYEQDTFQIVNNVTLLRGHQQMKFGIDYAQHNQRGLYGPFDSGNAVFVPIDFSAILGMPGLPFLTSLQAFDPTLRTPDQIAFLNFATAVLPDLIPGFPRGVPLANVGLPIVFIQGFGSGKVEPQGKYFSAYFQDDITVRPNFLLKAGLRYDLTRARFFDYPGNDGNFGPRLAFAYRPIDKLTVRGGYGIFYGAQFAGFAFPVGPSTRLKTRKIQQLPFPFSVLSYSQPARRFTDTSTFPPGVQFTPQLGIEFEISRDVEPYYSHQATFGFDYQLSKATVLSITYALTRGLHIFAERLGNPIVRPVPGNPVASALTGRDDPTRGDIILYTTASDSYYHGLTVEINRRLANKFAVLGHYTFSKAIDNATDVRSDLAEGPVNPFDLRAERGLSRQDARHRAVVSGLWELSYWKHPALRGFQLSSIIRVESGAPFNLVTGVDLDNNGDFPPFDRPLGLGRNTGELPGFASVDARLTHSINLGERFKIQSFIEAFNLFNRANIRSIDNRYPPDRLGRFNLPPKNDGGRFIATPDRFRSAFNPRELQLGLRFEF